VALRDLAAAPLADNRYEALTSTAGGGQAEPTRLRVLGLCGSLKKRTEWRLGGNDLCSATWVRTVSGPDGTDPEGAAATSGRGARPPRTGAGRAAGSG
jgi:hypothetical protein